MTRFQLQIPVPSRTVSALLVLLIVGAAILAISPESVRTANRRAAVGPGVEIYGYVGEQPLTGLHLRSNVRGVESNLAYMRGEIERTEFEAQRQMLEDVVAVIEQHGIVTAAVAGAVLDLTLYQHALDWGLLPSDDEVRARVARDRAQLRLSGEEFPDERFINEIDEDTFWEQWYPSVIERRLAINRLYQNRMAKLYSYGDVNPREAWYGQSVNFVEETTLVWAADDGEFTQVTLDQVVAYLTAMSNALPTDPQEDQPLESPEVLLSPENSNDSTA